MAASLVPRQLNGGSIAGAVVGSVVGALLLLFCIVLPLLRARRRRRTASDADLQAEMGQSPSTGGRSSPSQLDKPKKMSVDPLDPAHGPALDKPGLPTGSYPTSDSDLTGNGHPKPTSDHHPPQPSSLPPGVTIEQGLPSPISSPPARTLSLDQPTDQAYPTSPPDQPTPPPTNAPSRVPPSLSDPVSKQGTRDLSVTDSYGPPSRELTGITTTGITQEPESIEHPQRRFSHISGSIRSLLHRRRDSQQRRDSKRSTLNDGTRSPSVSTTGAFGQPELTQPVFEVDISAQGEAWSYYNDPNLIPLPSVPTGTTLFPPVHEAGQPPLSPVSLPDQQQFATGAGVPPFMIGQNVVEEPYDLFPNGATSGAPTRPYGGRTSLLRGPGGPLARTDSLPPLQPIVSDIDGPNFEFPILPSGNPMYIMGPPTNEAESAHHLQHEILRINSPPQPAALPLEYTEQTAYPQQAQYSEQTQYTQQPDYSQQSEVQDFIRNNMNGVGLGEPFIKNDMNGVDLNGPFLKHDMNGVDLNQVGYGYHSPPDIAVNGQDFNDMSFNSAMMGDHQQLDPQAVVGYPNNFTPPPSAGPSLQNTPETRLYDYTSSPSPRSDMDHRPALELESSPHFFPCPKCDRVFDQVHKLNHHKRYHERPHACQHPGCTMSFGTKTHLARHENDKHNKTRKFYCTQHDCPYSKQNGKSFPRKDNWRRHMLNKHHITPETDPVEYNDETMT